MRDEEWGAIVWRAVGSCQLKGEFATRSQSENSPGHFQLLGLRYLILAGQGSLGRGQGGAFCKALWETGPQDGEGGERLACPAGLPETRWGPGRGSRMRNSEG